jgi:folate-binding protein YgfZ
VKGADAKEFLHRVTTNDIRRLSPGEGTITLVLERTGRIVDRLLLAVRSADILLLGNAGRASAVRAWIEKYAIADDVQVEDIGESTRLVTMLGPGVESVLAACFGIDAASLKRYEHRSVEWRGGAATILRGEDVAGRSFHVMIEAKAFHSLWEALGALPAADEETYRALRIEAGIPGFPEEYDDRTIPLEARMTDAISFTKGCYIGQEVIARLHNFKRVKRALVRARIEGVAMPEAEATLVSNGAKVGSLTSAAPSGGALLALGYVEKGYEAPGTTLLLESEGSSRKVEILTLTPAGEPS